MLVDAKSPIIIVGGGVVISGAEAELLSLAEKLWIPTIVSEADVVMFIGCRAGSVTTERWRYPAPGGARIIHFDVDPTVIGANYRADVAVVGDARLALRNLVGVLGSHNRRNPEAAARVSSAKKRKFEFFRELASSDEMPIRPERIVAELQAVLPEDAVVVADPGTPCPYLSAFYQSNRTGRTFISNRAHGALGYSLSAVMGAQYGRPGAKCVSVMGDGSFGFTCGELETVVRQRLPITFVVISNSVYGWIKAGQKTGFEQRYFSVDFDRTDHAKVAEAFGVKSWRVDDPSKLRQTLAAAVEHGGPTLVDIITQPLQDARAPVSEWIA
jgi:acetolactate synthase-1/2/3 large subunit